MKHSLFNYLAASLLLIVASGCGSDDGSEPSRPSSDKIIRVEPSISTLTRTVFEGGTQKFAPGDEFSLYVWNSADLSDLGEGLMQGYDSRQQLGAGGEWTSPSPVKWKDETSPHYMLGVYPARKITDFRSDPYTLQGIGGDISDGARLIETNDLLVSVDKTGRTYTPEKISLGFSHLMSRLDVNVTFSNEWGSAPATTDILAKASGSCTIDYVSGASPSVTVTGSQQNIHIAPSSSVKAGCDASFSGIMIPQEGFRAIGIPADGRIFTFKNADDLKLLPGNITTVNLVVRTSTVELLDVTIEPWTEEPLEDLDPQIYGHPLELQAAGTLTSDMITSALEGGDKLYISGPMNGSDLRVLREFMGCKYDVYAETTPSPIHYLDMGGVNIVSGDDAYAIDFRGGRFLVLENDIIPGYMFYGLKSGSPMHIVLPRGTREIQVKAFSESEIDFIDMPETLEDIYSLAFGNSRIQEIKIPGRVTKIVYDAFNGCTNLKRVEISEGITSIDISTIVHDLKLEYLYLPYSLTSVYIQKIATDNLKTLKIMTTPGVLAAGKITLTKGGSNITGEYIECDLYLCNERQGEVTNGNTWAGTTWKSITFVDGTTLK